MATNNPNSNNGNSDSTNNNSSDILSTLLNQQTSNANTEIDLLKSIDKSVKDILKNGEGMSQSNAFNRMPGSRRSSFGRFSSGNSFSSKSGFGSAKNDFINAFQREIMEGILGSGFKDQMQGIMEKLAKDIGVDVEDIPKAFGKSLAKQAMSSNIGKSITGSLKNYASSALGGLKSSYTASRDKYFLNNPNARAAVDHANGARFAENWRRSQSGTRTEQPERSNLSGNASIKDLTIYAEHVVISQTDEHRPDINNNQNDSNENNPSVDMSEQEAMLKDYITDQLKGKVSDEILGSLDKDALSSIINAAGSGETGAMADVLSQLGLSGASGSGGLIEGITGLLGGGSGAGAAAAGAGETAALTATAGEAGAALAGVTAAAGTVCPVILAVVAAFEILKPALEGLVNLFGTLSNAFNRYENSREKQMENAQKRLEADIESIVKYQYEILEDAAKEMEDVWDSCLREISATQGYSKSDLQDLISSFAQRLRDEGLSSVISVSDITEDLTKVLESGLSGTVAEEFAYEAAKLNAAIPTQDFYEYASVYSSIAANAIKDGASQSEAIAEANEALEGFANNVLYASREIAGGFSTGLTDAESLFEQSVQIAQASKTGDSTEISAVMTAVSAITGAIAPDLATSMTDAIYEAATGGNSSQIVALRSLAGINASNTEFLKKLAEDPQTVFANLFNALAEKQNMSSDAYMEVAEGLSSIFGVSSDAFARVDFAYLADAISSMNSSSTALSENMELLASGETTTTAEQLKMQQINEYMIEEGLSYVLDNEAARAIQQHMWDEQIADELQETTYGVEIQGAMLEYIEGIRKTIDNIMTFLNPVGLISKISSGITNLVGSVAESAAQEADIVQLLELGKVGEGNSESLYQLTTRGTDLNLTESLIDLMGGTSLYNAVSDVRDTVSRSQAYWNSAYEPAYVSSQMYKALGSSSGSSTRSSKVNSAYSWSTVGKSAASTLSGSSSSGSDVAGISALSSSSTSSSTAASSSTSSLQKFLSSMESYFDEKGEDASYDEWLATSSRYGISDVSAALEGASVSEASVKGQFEAYQTGLGVEIKQEREAKEEQFWVDNVTQLTSANTWLETVYNKQVEFYDDFIKFHEDFLTYNQNFLDYDQHFLDYGGSEGYFNAYHASFNAFAGEDGTFFSNFVGDEGTPGTFRGYAQAFNDFAGEDGTFFTNFVGDEGTPGTFRGYAQAFTDFAGEDGTFFKEFVGSGDGDGTFKGFRSAFDTFVQSWTDYYLEHEAYSTATGVDSESENLSSLWTEVENLKSDSEAESREAVYKLAEALTQNNVDLLDPTVQTNVLLAEILQIVNAIMQQNGTSGSTTLAQSISGMALGVTNS